MPNTILRRFYDPLVLLNVIDPTRGAERPDLIKDSGFSDRSKLWRNFLDQLSWICDSETGGDTVTAIGAQKTVEFSVFWLASNSNAREKAKEHAVTVLEQLNRLIRADGTSVAQIEQEICGQCISFSFKRIKSYASQLLTAVRNARCQARDDLSPEGKQMKNRRDNHLM